MDLIITFRFVPWAICSPQCIQYFEQALQGPQYVSTSIHQAFCEHKILNFSWYETWSTWYQQAGNRPFTQTRFRKHFHNNLFVSQWQTNLLKQNKMEFCRRIQTNLGEEAYLGLSNRSHRVRIASIRISSHDLRIDKFRYGRIYTDPVTITWRFCCKNSDDNMIMTILQLPHFVKIL